MERAARDLEKKRIRELVKEYESRGYRVAVNPATDELPIFLRGMQPDLVAHGKRESVVIEVKTGSDLEHSTQLKRIADAVQSQPGWRFELVVTNPRTARDRLNLQIPSPELIRSRLHEAQMMIHSGNYEASVLLAWSALEGTLRWLANRSEPKLASQGTASLLRDAFSQGLVDRELYSLTNEWLGTRNALVHGGAVPHLYKANVKDFVGRISEWANRSLAAPAEPAG